MGERRIDVGAVMMHLALAIAVVGGALLMLRQTVPSLTAFAVAAGLFTLGRRTPPPVAPRREPSPRVQDLPLITRPAADTVDGAEPAEGSESGGSTESPQRAGDLIPRLPPPPAGRPVAPWAPATRRITVSDERRHAAAMARVRRRGPHLRAVLVSDLNSPHHPFAVAVHVDEEYVGDLTGDALLDYGERLATLAVRGIDISPQAVCLPHGLDIDLPEPEGLVPENDVPAGVVLPHGSPSAVEAVTPDAPAASDAVEASEAAGRVLARYVRPGRDVWLAVTLAAVRPPRRRDPVREIDVLLDGVVVGRVRHDEVEDFAPLLAFCKDRDLVPVVAAVLRGSSLHSRLTLSCIRAHDADEDWLRSLGR